MDNEEDKEQYERAKKAYKDAIGKKLHQESLSVQLDACTYATKAVLVSIGLLELYGKPTEDAKKLMRELADWAIEIAKEYKETM